MRISFVQLDTQLGLGRFSQLQVMKHKTPDGSLDPSSLCTSWSNPVPKSRVPQKVGICLTLRF